MIDWDDLRFLLAVRERGSATSAARTLGVDKATVTRRVTRLERELGVRLLLRRASGWRATGAGERTAVAARAIEQHVRELRSDFSAERGAPRTAVSVTAPHWFCSELLLPALPRLVAEASWLDITVAATSRVLSLAQREADVALRNTRPAEGDFTVRKAGELGSALYASRAYAKKHPAPNDAAGFSRHRVVGYPDRVTYVPGFRWFDEAASRGAAIVRTDDAKALTEALKAGVGIGVVPCFLGDREKDLVRFVDEVHRERIWLASPAEASSTRAVKLTLDFVVSVFRANAAALAG